MPAEGEPPEEGGSLSLPPLVRGARHVIAVASGRAGVGASTVAVNLGVYLAQLGRRVVLVDADPVGAQLHALLGVSLDPRFKEDDSREEVALVPTPVPGL